METPGAPDSKEFTLQSQKRIKLEEEISNRSREIVELKKEVNKLTSTSVLPPEILSEIFLCYVASCEGKEEEDEMVKFLSNDLRVYLNLGSRREGSHDQSHDRPYYAFRVAQVCHHWREVALCSPRLWSRVVLVRSDASSCVKEMLRRSQQAPLSVMANVVRVSSLELLKLMFKDMHRIQSIDLALPDKTKNVGNLLHDLFHKDAPMLRSISMDYFVTGLDNCPPLLLPSHNLPRFTRLSIFTNHLDYAASLFRTSLKHLEIDTAYRPAPCTTVLSLLAGTPLLETLSIVDGVMGPSSEGWEGGSSEPIIELSHLQLLEISCPTEVCLFFLKRLSFPSSTSIQLDCGWDDFIEHHRQVVPTLMSRQAECKNKIPTDESQLDRLNIVSLSFSEGSLQFRAYIRSVLQSSFLIHEQDVYTPKLCVKLQACPEAIQLVEELCLSLPLTGVRTLIVSDTHTSSQYSGLSISHATWEKISTGLLNLRRLVVSGYDADALLTMSRQMRTVGEKLGTISEELLCPRLQILELLSTKFKSDYDAPGPDDFFDRLMESLRYRRDSGKELPQLDIKCAINLGPEQVEELRQTVKELRWDGAEIYEDIDEEDETDYFD